MANRIRQVNVNDKVLDPAHAEVWISVLAENLTSTTEIRGRLMGPRCAYSHTVEVAYPLQPIPGKSERKDRLLRRVIIPEPNLWDPESPFLYQGPVELWEEGQCLDRVTVSHGLRKVQIVPAGLRWNGSPLIIRGIARKNLLEQEAPKLREMGFNTLMVPVKDETLGSWETADRLGFLVLGILGASFQDLKRIPKLWNHSCCLGWVMAGEGVRDGRPMVVHRGPRSFLLGGGLDGQPRGPLSPGLQFVLCGKDLVPALETVSLPKVVLADDWTEESKLPSSSGCILGWIKIREP